MRFQRLDSSLSRGGAMVILGEDWFDHYGTMAIYPRVNGITPPSGQQGIGRIQLFPHARVSVSLISSGSPP
jgi:hypothetical protein